MLFWLWGDSGIANKPILRNTFRPDPRPHRKQSAVLQQYVGILVRQLLQGLGQAGVGRAHEAQTT